MDEEGISKLPGPILHHILSFLSDKKAVQTCVVSKSWRHLGSTRPKFCLKESYFRRDKEKFMYVLGKSLQVYYDQKLCIDDFSVSSVSTDDPELVSLLEEWIPIVVHVLGAKKFRLSISGKRANLVNLPSAVFESESLEEINLERCKLSQINISSNSFGKNKHLKSLILQNVHIEEEESFAEFLSSCSSIEDLSLRYCRGLQAINMHNHHNLKSFELYNNDDDEEIFLPSIIGYKHFPRLTCLRLINVFISDEWFNSFSCNFPCLEELKLFECNGFDEFKLSSPSIKKLHITMDEATTKATIDTPSIKEFYYKADISQSISFTATTSGELSSKIHLSLDQLDASLWFPKISELVAAFSQSQINSLVLYHDSGIENQLVGQLPDISVCCSGSYKLPVSIEILALILDGLYYESFFSDLSSGLFRMIRPREIKQYWYVDAQQEQERRKNEVSEFLCRTLQMGRWEEEEDEEEMRRFFSWQQDLEEVSLQVCFGSDSVEWRPVQGTINWSEYVAALLPLRNMSFCELRFRLKWKE